MSLMVFLIQNTLQSCPLMTVRAPQRDLSSMMMVGDPVEQRSTVTATKVVRASDGWQQGPSSRLVSTNKTNRAANHAADFSENSSATSESSASVAAEPIATYFETAPSEGASAPAVATPPRTTARPVSATANLASPSLAVTSSLDNSICTLERANISASPSPQHSGGSVRRVRTRRRAGRPHAVAAAPIGIQPFGDALQLQTVGRRYGGEAGEEARSDWRPVVMAQELPESQQLHVALI
eukprot:SAG31_NODE_337_length_17493_cov_5.855755_11_plen_239_part_00